MPENTGQKQENGRFQKGVSGNPSGKPKGIRHRSTLLAERLFGDEIRDICVSVIAEAKKGDMQAAKIILDRILPPRRDRLVAIDLPQIEKGVDLVQVMRHIVNAVSSGQISPSEGEALARILDIHAKTLELIELEQRVVALEKKPL